MGLFDFIKKKKEVPNLDFIKGTDTNKVKKYIEIPFSIKENLIEIDKVDASSMDVNTKVDTLYKIYESLTDSQKEGKEGRYLIIRIGEVCFREKMIEDALENFNFSMRFNDTVGNPFLHLRLGQLQYCIGNKDKMIDELSRALIMGGEQVFENESPVFINAVKEVLREPEECSWEEYEGQDWESTK